MFPILFRIGQWPLYTYGLFIATGSIIGILLVEREAKKLGQDHEQIMDLCIYLLIAAIVGSRLFYIFSNPIIFLSDPMEIFRIWNGGLVFYGGFITAMIAAILYLKGKNLSLFLTADIIAPPLALGHFFGRLGCLFGGCCYGKATNLPWAIIFTKTDSLAPLGVPLHPTQLYAAINNLLIFIFLWFFRRRKKFTGQIFWMYVLLYGITRSFIEMFRGDFRGELILEVLSISQVIAAGMTVMAVVMLILLPRNENLNLRLKIDNQVNNN